MAESRRRGSSEGASGATGARGRSEKGARRPHGADAESPESRGERTGSLGRTIIGAFLLAGFIRIALFEAFEIEGPSMEPTLQNGDRVVVAKMLYGLFPSAVDDAILTWGGPRVGDVVIIKSPADGVDIVKRVVAVGGDRIAVRSGVLFRNGERVPQALQGECEARLQLAPDPRERCEVFEETLGGGDEPEVRYEISQNERMCPRHHSCHHREVTVPEGHIFVRGDHRDHSHDSMDDDIGFVPLQRVRGRALFIYLSTDRTTGGAFFRWDRFFSSVR